jgi:hypothetical protein
MTGSGYVAQASLKLTILLPQPPECWDYRQMPLCLASWGTFNTHHIPVPEMLA